MSEEMKSASNPIERLTDENYSSKLDELYNGSALTFEGVVPEEVPLWIGFFKDFTNVNEDVTAYLFSGKMMNDKYGLTGDNAYPDELNILSVPLDAFENAGKIALPRMQIGGRWFDDIVDNNARREGN